MDDVEGEIFEGEVRAGKLRLWRGNTEKEEGGTEEGRGGTMPNRKYHFEL